MTASRNCAHGLALIRGHCNKCCEGLGPENPDETAQTELVDYPDIECGKMAKKTTQEIFQIGL
jgi:hypothetical protein